MGFIGEFLGRNTLKKEVLEIVHQNLDQSVLEKLQKETDKKSQKKFEKIISSLKFKLKDYKSTKKLGLYGTSKLLKVVQDEMLSLGIEPELVRGVVKKLMM